MAPSRARHLHILLLCMFAFTALAQDQAVHEASHLTYSDLAAQTTCGEGSPDCLGSGAPQEQQQAQAQEAAEAANLPGSDKTSGVGEAAPAPAAASVSGSGALLEPVPEPQGQPTVEPTLGTDSGEPTAEVALAAPVEQTAPPAAAAEAPAATQEQPALAAEHQPAAATPEQAAPVVPPVVPEQLPPVPEAPAAREEDAVLEEEPRNFALSKDGAKVVQANKEAKKLNALLDCDSDTYVKNDCKADKWFIIELSQLAKINKVELHQYELYSSRVKSFEVRGRQTHPRVDGVELSKGLNSSNWKLLGALTAENKKGAQLFTLEQPIWVRFLLLLLQSHYGSEPMCAINGFAAYGKSAAEELEDHLAADDTLHYLQSTLDDNEPEPALPQPIAATPPAATVPAPVSGAGSTGGNGAEGSQGRVDGSGGGGAEASAPVQQEQPPLRLQQQPPLAAAAPALEQQDSQQECGSEASSCPGESTGSCSENPGGQACTAQLQQEGPPPPPQQQPGSGEDAAAVAAPAPIPVRASVEDVGKPLGSGPGEVVPGSRASSVALEAAAGVQLVSEPAPASEPATATQQLEGDNRTSGTNAALNAALEAGVSTAAASKEQGAQPALQSGASAGLQQQHVAAPSGQQPPVQEQQVQAAQQQQQQPNGEGAADEVNPFLAATPKPKASASVYDILLQEIKAAKVQQKLASKLLLELQRNVSQATAELASEVASLTAQLAEVQREATTAEEALVARLDALVGARLQQLSQEVLFLQQAVAASARRELALACLLGMLGLVAMLWPASKGVGRGLRWVRWAVLLLALGNAAAGLAMQLLGGWEWSPAAMLHALRV